MVEPALHFDLKQLLRGRVVSGELMKNHTSWQIGGPADVFVEPEDREDLQLVVSYAYRHGIPLTVVGAGSNLLVSECGIRGIVVKISSGLNLVLTAGNEIIAEAGAKLVRVAAAAKEAGLGGFEFTAGIPGTVGGAVAMNAGANGFSISRLVRDALMLDFKGEYHRKVNQELSFGYRASILQEEPLILVEVSFNCFPRDKSEIAKEMAYYIGKRRLTQPLVRPNAGSVFKNPPGDSAGRLIEAAGLKGLRIGDAQISTLHANFIVNLGAATSREVLALIEKAGETVHTSFGVKLEPEIKIIGND
jgi:UDP-N-acetylmuramate dehydrogenase